MKNPGAVAPVETSILNVAAYQFVTLDSLPERRAELQRLCAEGDLRGTILLSPEGINLFIAGIPGAVRNFIDTLRKDPVFADLETKDSYSGKQPFRRMLVRLKREIIAFGVESIRPQERTSPKLPAKQLRKWLDEGRPIRMLDVRNDYEVELGTFRGAEQLHIGHFRDFPRAIEQFSQPANDQPIVMFCTGGIRCEKAGPLMEQAGFSEVYQLDGGILKYFEECGGEHYDGSCFVFDGRVALDSDLKPTGDLLCFACQAVLSPEDVSSDRFLMGKHCPNCYQDPEESHRQQLAERQQRIRAVGAEQPGMQPYDNIREIFVPRRLSGMPLIDFLHAWHPSTGRDQWSQWLGEERITFQRRAVSADLRVKEGQGFEHHMPDTVEPEINPDVILLHEDQSLVVVDKPAPLPVHPSGRFNRNTLSYILGQAYPNEKLRVAHRLDANTTGVVLLCRKYHPAKFVQPQFSNHQVDKRYVARVHGHPAWQQIRCEASISPHPAEVGARVVDSDGQVACTELKVLQLFPDQTALISAIPITGRTNQIRVHLWHLGHSVVGDPLYLPDHQHGLVQTLSVGQRPMCLHAASLTLVHPDTKLRATFEAPLPAWTTS